MTASLGRSFDGGAVSCCAAASAAEPLEIPFVDAVPDDLQCGICFQATSDPVVTEDCGHLFCRECIAKALERKRECPIDRLPLTINDVRKDVRTQRKVMALMTYCINKRSGCGWKGAYSDMEKHTERCEFALVKCPFAPHGCDITVTRKTLAEHLTTGTQHHLTLLGQVTARLMDENFALQQELDLIQREEQRFVWVIPQFQTKHGPVYSRKFCARGLMWYLGVDFEGPDQHAGVYLFAEGHTKRVNFKLILLNVDPQRDKTHTVNDWAPDYKGKGWGPLKFIDRSTIAANGFVVNGCVRVGAEIDDEPFD